MRLTNSNDIKQAMKQYMLLGFLQPEKWQEISEDYVAAYNKIKDSDLNYYDFSMQQAKSRLGKDEWTIGHQSVEEYAKRLPEAPQKPGPFARFLNWAFGYKTESMRTYESQLSEAKSTVTQMMEEATELREAGGFMKEEKQQKREQSEETKEYIKELHNKPDPRREKLEQMEQMKEDLLKGYQKSIKNLEPSDPKVKEVTYRFVVQFNHLQMNHMLACTGKGYTQEQVNRTKEESEQLGKLSNEKISEFVEKNGELKNFIDQWMKPTDFTMNMSVSDYIGIYLINGPENMFTEELITKESPKEPQKEVDVKKEITKEENQKAYDNKLRNLSKKLEEAKHTINKLQSLTPEEHEKELDELKQNYETLQKTGDENYKMEWDKIVEAGKEPGFKEIDEAIAENKEVRKPISPQEVEKRKYELKGKKSEYDGMIRKEYDSQCEKCNDKYQKERESFKNQYLSKMATEKGIDIKLNALIQENTNAITQIEKQQALLLQGKEMNVPFTDTLEELTAAIEKAQKELGADKNVGDKEPETEEIAINPLD